VIVDTEFYWDPNPLDGVTYDLPTTWQMEHDAGVDHVVIMTQPYLRPLNAEMYQAWAKYPHPERFTLCCTLNAQFGAETVAELERCVTQYGMKALKLMPTLHGYSLLSGGVKAVMDKARELGIVINIHSGSHQAHPLQIAVLARRYPELLFVMDHMGYREFMSDAVVAAQECPNIYLSTTLVSAGEPLSVKFVTKQVGPERVVFGSNAPGTFIDMCLEAIRRQGMGSEAEALIFGGNAARIYGLAGA
jgi:predicted TIM-barrel fold metal-dependent hydrolase